VLKKRKQIDTTTRTKGEQVAERCQNNIIVQHKAKERKKDTSQKGKKIPGAKEIQKKHKPKAISGGL